MNTIFDSYIAEYSADLTRLCASLCGNMADADDLFQETWYKAIKNYEQFNINSDFDKWLYSICVNTYKDSIKLAFNRRRIVFKSEEEKAALFNTLTIPESVPRDDFIELHKAMNALPKKYKIIVVLFYFKDYSIKEVSDILNIPEGTVKSRMQTAKNMLKRRLKYE